MTFEELKDKVDLQAYVTWLGYKKDESKSTSRQMVYNGLGNEKIVLLHHRTTGELIYQNLQDSADRGNIINFVTNRLNGYVSTGTKSRDDYKRTSEELKKYLKIPIEQRSTIESEKAIESKKYYFNFKLFNPKALSNTEYLESRGILKETIHSPHFQGLIINCQQYDFLRKQNLPEIMTGFVITNNDNKIEGLDMRKPGEKTFALGSNKSESFWRSNASSQQNRMVVIESPIDALSYHQIKGDNSNRYYSTNGNMTDYQIAHIKDNIDKGIYSKLALATDNDVPGFRFDLRILSLFLKDKMQIISTKKDQMEIEIQYPSEERKRIVLENVEQYKKFITDTLKLCQLDKVIELDKVPEGVKDWNQIINPLEKKNDMSELSQKKNQIESTSQISEEINQGENKHTITSKETSQKNADFAPLEIKNVLLTKEQREELDNGKHIFLKGMFDQESGKKKDGYVHLEEYNGRKSIAVRFAEKELVIEDKIMNYKLSPVEKAKLHQGETLGPLKLDKDFSAYLQVDKNRNRVVVKTDSELGIPKKIGGYELNDQDKNRLANNEKMMPRIFKGKHGYFMASVKLTEDRKGLEYTGIVGLSNEEALKKIPVINSSQEQTLSNVLDVSKGVFEQEQQKAHSEKIPSDDLLKDKGRLEHIAKSNGDTSIIDHIFGSDNKDKDAFLKRYDLYDRYTRHQELGNAYASYTDNPSRKNVTVELDVIAKEITGIAKDGLSKMDKGIVESVATNPDLSKIVQPSGNKAKEQSMSM